MAHARCMLDKQGNTHVSTHPLPCTHTHTSTPIHTRTCNTYCFSTARMVSWTRLRVTLCVYCVYCLLMLAWKVSVKCNAVV
jgi:hypothetical protein